MATNINMEDIIQKYEKLFHQYSIHVTKSKWDVEFNWPFSMEEKDFLMSTIGNKFLDDEDGLCEFSEDVNSLLVKTYVVHQCFILASKNYSIESNLNLTNDYLIEKVFHTANQIVNKSKTNPINGMLKTYLTAAVEIILDKEINDFIKYKIIDQIVELVALNIEKVPELNSFHEIFSAAVILNNSILNDFIRKSLFNMYDKCRIYNRIYFYITFIQEIILGTLNFNQKEIDIVDNFIKNIIPGVGFTKNKIIKIPFCIFRAENIISPRHPTTIEAHKTIIVEFAKMIYNNYPTNNDRDLYIREQFDLEIKNKIKEKISNDNQ